MVEGAVGQVEVKVGLCYKGLTRKQNETETILNRKDKQLAETNKN